MKETYFTAQNIKVVTKKIIKDISKFQRNIKIPYIPEKSALLILDMQNFFLNQHSHAFIPSASAIVVNINRLLSVYRRYNLNVMFTRHINTNKDAKMMKKWWESFINPEDKESEIIDSLNSAESKIITKTQYDAFYKTELEHYLINNNIEQLVVTGLMTHLCCETTIRSAFVRGFTVFFPVDGTATYNMDFHKSSCINLSHGFAVCTFCESLWKKI